MTQEVFKEVRNSIGFYIIIKEYRVRMKEYNSIFEDIFTTIFSNGVILEDHENIDSDTTYTNVSPHIINFNKNDKIVFIDFNTKIYIYY